MGDSQNNQNSGAFVLVSSGQGGAIASFRNEIFIHPDKRLMQLDQGPVFAYAASGMSDVSQVTHFAMICDPSLTPRSQFAGAYASINNPCLVKLVASGTVYWPPAKGERYTFIYEMPVGRPLCAEGQYAGLGMRPDTVLGIVLSSICPVLLDLRDTYVVHGNIRPSTVYGVGSGPIERLVFGECLSVPSSMTQKAMFEPVERAMAMPLGRGMATPENDIYAVGALLAIMLRTRDPMEGMTDEQMVQHKLEVGSLAAFTGKDRISGNMIELLRGLLNEDAKQRWTVDNIRSWMDGQHISPKQGFKRAKAARPLAFENERYFRPDLLARDLNKNQAEAAQLVETRALEQWISRSLEDPAILKRLESAIDSTEQLGRGPGYWDRLLCRVSIALDPTAPIRYKGLSLFPDAFGPALTNAMVARTDLQPYIDLINQQTIAFWASSQPNAESESAMNVSRFENCRAFLRQNNIAYGIERCLYLLNPDCPCLSEKLRGYYVSSPEGMMRAFERIATQPGRPELFFDRHAVAFLSVKEGKNVDSFLVELNSSEPSRKILGNIKVLATIQQRSRMEKFPGICKWISEILAPVYERIHDRELRHSMKAKIEKLVETGDITRIAGILGNPQTSSYDNEAYNQARIEYYNLNIEYAALEKKMKNPAIFARGIGRDVAALMSCVLSGLAILFFIFKIFSKGSIF